MNLKSLGVGVGGGGAGTAMAVAMAVTVSTHPSALAQVFLFSSGLPVPDGTGAGLADARTVLGAPTLASVTVGLKLRGMGEGMVNGDLFVTLSHETATGQVDAYVVLLNRPGKRSDHDEGYFDSGIDLEWVGGTKAPDVHNYRMTLSGSHAVPLGGALTGVWSPDGRETDPDLVLDTDSRTTSLDTFVGVNPNSGQWVLYVADLLEGGEARLDAWSLTFTEVAVPEPSVMGWMAGTGLAGWALARRLGSTRRMKEMGDKW